MRTFIQKTKPVCHVLIALLLSQGIPLSTVSAKEEEPVQNVRFEISGARILILYDLKGSTSENYAVRVTLKRTSSTTFAYIPKIVSGDVGEGKWNGKSRQIVWDILREFPQGLEGDDFYFVITANVLPSGSNTWLWIGGGAAAVVGGATYFLLKGTVKAAGTSGDTGFPQPTGRPSGN